MFTHVSRLFAITFAGAAALAASESHAGTLPTLTVQYSADRTIDSETGSFTGKVFAGQGKERAEMSMSGMQSVTILRHDKQMGWVLMPAQHMYQTMDFAKAREQSASAPSDVEIESVGSETINGFATTKFKLIMKDGSAGGFVWSTNDGIPVKMDMLSKSGRQKTRITVTLSNIQIAPQDDSLFEVPSGYTAMPSFGGLGKLLGR